MIYLIVALIAVSVGLLVYGLVSLPSPAERGLQEQLESLKSGKQATYRQLQERRRRQERRKRLGEMLEALGERLTDEEETDEESGVRQKLNHAGFRQPSAVAIYNASRLLAAAGIGVGGFFLAQFMEISGTQAFLYAGTGALGGWMLPYVYVNRKKRSRQQEIQNTLPDALDLLVVCVEAGLGLNQALMRVGEEVERMSPALSEEMALVNLQIRAGNTREESLKNFAERTGLEDVQSLVSMMIQADRFGTSIAKALRVHADTLRTKRRQRAEEQAAKLSVKMLFPLIFFVFPSIFVVILGPSVFRVMEAFGGGGL